MDEFNALPDHILVEVFGNLSPKMIKSCSLVCKRWDEIIGNSRELMGRFKLNLYNHSNDIKEAMELRRKHQAAMVKILSEDSLDVISRHKLQSLTLCKTENIKLSTTIEALNRFTSLKVFDAYYDAYIDDISGSSNFKKVQVNLEELRCAVEIIHIFECCTVKILKTFWSNSADDNRKMLAIDFLRRQKDLEELSLVGAFSDEFFTVAEIFDLKFELKKFEFDCRFAPLPHYEAFIKFLQQHKKTLRSLIAKFCTEPEFGIEIIHKFALENLMNLKHLELGYVYNRNGGLSFDELPSATQVTKNIESLTLNARSTDMNENKRFFAMFPNLKHLNIVRLNDKEFEVLCCISEINTNVEILQIFSSDFEFVAKVYFPKLREFSVIISYDQVNLSSFINRHSKTLEKITLTHAQNITIKEILNCANLKYLKLYRDELSFFLLWVC